MVMIVEHGYGVANANSYVSIEWADRYFLDLINNDWNILAPSLKERALIKATDYIETRFGPRFLGSKAYASMMTARNVLTLLGQPTAGQTITVGGVIFTFGTTILIGPTIYATLNNILVALNNAFTDIDVEFGFDMDILLICSYFGADAEAITTTTNSPMVKWYSPKFTGGSSFGVSQGLSFPRYGLRLADGGYIFGVPDDIKKATCEYAIHALNAELFPKPKNAEDAQVVKRRLEKLGPIEEEIEYQDGDTPVIHAFPAADALLRPYVSNAGGVYR